VRDLLTLVLGCIVFGVIFLVPLMVSDALDLSPVLQLIVYIAYLYAVLYAYAVWPRKRKI
jgi:hypothetical protein